MLGKDILGTGSSRTAGLGLDGASPSPKESLVGSEKVPPTAAGTIALSPPLAEGVGQVELAVVFIPFRSGTEKLDGVSGAAGIAAVTGSQHILQHPIFDRSSLTDSTGVVGEAHPEMADDEVESVLVEGTGLRPARVERLGCEGRTGSILVG